MKILLAVNDSPCSHAAVEAVARQFARHEILECAAAWQPDLIVLGSHGRHGIDRFVLGSVSEGALRRASCSVEVVK